MQERTRSFRSTRTRSLLAVRWLSICVAVSAAVLGVELLWLRETVAADRTLRSQESLARLLDLGWFLERIAWSGGAVLFVAWLYRAYANLPALGVSRPRYGRGWAIGGWLIPIASLWIPKRLANDVWRSGDSELRMDDSTWQERPVAGLVHWWWALVLIGAGLLGLAGQLLDEARDFYAYHIAMIADACSHALLVLAALAAASMVKRASARQELRAAVLRA
jgi:Domain of unknown function (DUF4328)